MWRDNIRQRSRKSYRNKSAGGGNTKIAKYAKFAFFSLLGMVFLGVLMIVVLSFTLPSPDKLIRREGFATKILDRNGEVLYDIYSEQKRSPVELQVIPKYLQEATIAVEDKNFYKHSGFDLTAYPRALFNIVFKGKLQGGSTLTQQLVKNVLLSSERTIVRKVKEFVLTLQIESRYSKDEILTMYLNEVPYGGTSFGVEAASETYFGKKVGDLNLVESAFLAGLPQRPSYYSPYSSNPTAYIARSEHVLERMKEDGYISADQAEEAKKQLPDLKFQARGADFKAPHFVQYVQDILIDRYGEAAVTSGGLTVTTTLDLKLQETAQDIVKSEIEKVEGLQIGNGAAVVLNSDTGEILAMVGSKDFNAPDYDGQVNVTTSLRQPGSAIKPITYVTGLKKGYTASTLLMDVPTEFPGGAGQPAYKPENYDGKYRGPIQVRYALANSINVAAVKMLAMVGIKDTLQTAYDLGITSLEPTNETLKRVGLSLTLGGGEVKLLELTGAYGAFMNGGYRIDPIGVLKVEDRNGKVLEEAKPKHGKQVISSGEAFIVDSILSDNEARSLVFGTNSLLNIPGVAVKTGTTNDKRDNWAIGGNPQVVVGAWVGNNDNSPMKQVASGVSGATPIWRKIVLAALEGKPKVNFTVPDDVVQVSVDKISGYKEHDGFPSREEYFVRGTEPGNDPVHLKLKICKNGSGLATPSDVAGGNYDEQEYFAFKEEDPTAASGGTNKWQEGILAWINEQNNPQYNPPTSYCSGSNSAPINVEFREPTDRSSNLSNDLTIKFTVDSINKISLVEFYVDGNKVRSYTSGPYEYSDNFSDGVHTLKAVATDEKNNQSDRIITIGVNSDWNASPSPSSTP